MMIAEPELLAPERLTSSLRSRIIATGWPAVLITGLYLSIGSIGYSPTDDGNLLAQSYRILHGQLPHKDIIFARPMGSALLHIVDFIIPLPLFKASRLTGITEVVVFSLLLAAIVFGRLPSKWTLPLATLAAASALVNMHTFPLMAWYTTDGLVFTALGFVLLTKGLSSRRLSLVSLGMLSLGTAPVMKQSFFLAPVLGFLLILWHWRRDGRRATLTATSVGLLMAAMPLGVYVLVISALGGFHALIHQLTHVHDVSSVFTNGILKPWESRQTMLLIFGFLVLTLISLLARTSNKKDLVSARWADWAARLGMSALAVSVPLLNRFAGWYLPTPAHGAIVRTWPTSLFWILIVALAWEVVVSRHLDGAGILILAIAWMTALSWGYYQPSLVSGSMLLATLTAIWRPKPLWPARPAWSKTPRLATVSALCALALIGASFLAARNAEPYMDRPSSQLTASMDSVSPQFRGLRTNPVTASYLAVLGSCVKDHPARWTAVLPDNPGIYPALKLHNPFPIDWMYPAEVEGVKPQILAAARRLGREGGYLILFQTYSAFDLVFRSTLGTASPASQPFSYGSTLSQKIEGLLPGHIIACGPFVGIYQRTGIR